MQPDDKKIELTVGLNVTFDRVASLHIPNHSGHAATSAATYSARRNARICWCLLARRYGNDTEFPGEEAKVGDPCVKGGLLYPDVGEAEEEPAMSSDMDPAISASVPAGAHLVESPPE